MALYVYGIMRAGEAARAAADAEPSEAVALEAIEHEHVGALVSPTSGELRLRRDNILAHADVLQAAFEHGPVLPFRFGTVVADAPTVIQELLAPSAEGLRSRLDALEGKAEMQVKATYLEEPLLRSILAQDPRLAQAVQRSQGMPAAASHFERIRIGEAIAGAVQSRRATDEQALVHRLAGHALAHAVSPPHHERAVMNAAFLIDRAELERFDGAAEELSREHGDMEFKLVGPLPPYSFADRDWEATPGGEVKAGWA